MWNRACVPRPVRGSIQDRVRKRRGSTPHIGIYSNRHSNHTQTLTYLQIEEGSIPSRSLLVRLGVGKLNLLRNMWELHNCQ